MTRMAATRDGYGQALLELAENEKVVVLEADLGNQRNHYISKPYPNRTVWNRRAKCYLLEQGSLQRIHPFASTFAIFTERAFEQMRNGVARLIAGHLVAHTVERIQELTVQAPSL